MEGANRNANTAIATISTLDTYQYSHSYRSNNHKINRKHKRRRESLFQLCTSVRGHRTGIIVVLVLSTAYSLFLMVSFTTSTFAAIKGADADADADAGAGADADTTGTLQSHLHKQPQENQTFAKFESSDNLYNGNGPATANITHIATPIRPHPHAGAKFPNGSYGYVANPAALRIGRDLFLDHHAVNSVNSSNNHYWAVMESYGRKLGAATTTEQDILTSNYICNPGPGKGSEEEGGYKLLTEKIQVYHSDNTNLNHANSKGGTTQRGPKILCAVYTYPRMRDLLRAGALSWGHKCDGFLAFSNETISQIGLVNLPHEGEESYWNMWQKTRSIWAYLHDNYLQEYDFFHLGGDDMYIIVENLRKFLNHHHAAISIVPEKQSWKNHDANDSRPSSPPPSPLLFGQWVKVAGTQRGGSWIAVGGGPGYTLNRAALSLLVKRVLPYCDVHLKASWEDRAISRCFQRYANMTPADTRDPTTGEQTYHDVHPNNAYIHRATTGRGHFHAKQMAFWETLPQPQNTTKATISTLLMTKKPNNRSSSSAQFDVVGPKHGLQAAATYSVSFHDINRPSHMARLHGLIFKEMCPADSPLGRGLRAHL